MYKYACVLLYGNKSIGAISGDSVHLQLSKSIHTHVAFKCADSDFVT